MLNKTIVSRPPSTKASNRYGPGNGGLVRDRRFLIVVAGALVAGALILGWNWLAAAAVPALLLSVLPCVVMCVLGLCMAGRRDKTRHKPVSEVADENPRTQPTARDPMVTDQYQDSQ
ncbi:MAG: hypothetical protein ACREEE_09195 [Dongiaceae bacterium]